ncbi:MAG: deaminase [Rhodospirillaceae bacterium]|nr:deaminase [Rhodospirillaceae bacterium]|tara:strand:+ start:1073 stop:1993 length:921 start_codon:yes stop_codon:yes gene_type:complete
MLFAAICWTKNGNTPGHGARYGLDEKDKFSSLPIGDSRAILVWDDSLGWTYFSDLSAEIRDFLDLYLPICNSPLQKSFVIGHLGQGLDGYIAASSGDSNYVTGRENILHLHRMRALCDAVVVGAGTALSDNPRLTTREVKGKHPVRVIIDPQLRLPSDLSIFTDEVSETLIFFDEKIKSHVFSKNETVSLIGVPLINGRLDLESLLNALNSRGLMTVFVEGGGKTVSGFLEKNLLNRLQIAISPLVIGEGIPGIRVTPKKRLKDCLRPHSRVFRMGNDILFDCDLRSIDREVAEIDSELPGISRIN